MFRFFFFLIVLIRYSCVAQEFTVKPYLQNAGPNSIVISWEYSNYDSSFLEWGKTSNLGNTVLYCGAGGANKSLGSRLFGN